MVELEEELRASRDAIAAAEARAASQARELAAVMAEVEALRTTAVSQPAVCLEVRTLPPLLLSSSLSGGGRGGVHVPIRAMRLLIPCFR